MVVVVVVVIEGGATTGFEEMGMSELTGPDSSQSVNSSEKSSSSNPPGLASGAAKAWTSPRVAKAPSRNVEYFISKLCDC